MRRRRDPLIPFIWVFQFAVCAAFLGAGLVIGRLAAEKVIDACHQALERERAAVEREAREERRGPIRSI